MSTITDNIVPPALLASVNTAKTKAADASSAAGAQDRFLTLLVTQMKNQDPLNPMDNAQVTSQLAQLSTVSGIDKLNTTLEALKGNYQSSQSLQAASLIGHGVLLPGSSTTLANGKALMGIDVTEAADDVKLTIRDASGRAIHTMDLGRQEIGTLPLEWDGKTDTGAAAVSGQYKFEVTATRGGEKTAAEALSFGQVSSVSTNAHGVKLNVPNIGAVDLASVRQFL
ncbi:MAG: flagellar hook assembly protein FlgD [Herminiimonas sp.]|nr:flagellar hook assembly protein FlgD [Herminiimonas sp.]